MCFFDNSVTVIENLDNYEHILFLAGTHCTRNLKHFIISCQIVCKGEGRRAEVAQLVKNEFMLVSGR